jgi:putative transposase
MDYQHSRHSAYLIVYHLIFYPMRRHRPLIGPVQKRLEQIPRVITEHNWQLLELAIQPDHVHGKRGCRSNGASACN